MPDEFEGLPPEFIKEDPRTGNRYFDHQGYEEYLKSLQASQNEGDGRVGDAVEGALRSQRGRAVGRDLLRNTRVGRNARVTRLVARRAARKAEKALLQKAAVKTAVKVGGKLVAGVETGGLGLILFIPDVVSVLKSKKVQKVLLGLIVVLISIPILLILTLFVALNPHGGGDGTYQPGDGSEFSETTKYIQVDKKVSPSEVPNQVSTQVEYTLTVKNLGGNPLTGLKVEDETLTKSGQTCSISGSSVGVGDELSCTYTTTISGVSDTYVINYATISGMATVEGAQTTVAGTGSAIVTVGTPTSGPSGGGGGSAGTPEPGLMVNCPPENTSVVAPGATESLLGSSSRSRRCIKPSIIIMHWSAGTTNNGANATRNTLNQRGLSCQYGVDGSTALQMLKMYPGAVEESWCAGAWNDRSINIEMSGSNFDNDPSIGVYIPPPESELKRTVDLVCWLMKQYSMSADDIYGHFNVPNNKGKSDPGRVFLETFKNRVRSSCGG